MPLALAPHDYQINALCQMVSLPGYGLFAHPGLGKTATALAAFLALRDAGAAKAMLVVAPLRPCYKVWPSEMAKWSDFADMTVGILHGPKKDKVLTGPKKDVYVVNYDGLKWLEAALSKMKVFPFDVLCLDESTKIKNTQTARFKICKRLRDRFSRVWCLTGTPAPNGIENLFGQVYMLDGGERLGKFVTHFRREYFHEEKQYGYSLWHPRHDTQDRVQKKIADITLALRAEDYLKMPRRFDNRIEVSLGAEALDVYKGIEDEFIAEVNGGMVTAANAAAKGMKMRQITGGAVYTTSGKPDYAELDDAKITALLDLIEEQEGEPLLVAVQFTHEVERIRKALGYNAPYLGGGVSISESNRIVDEWNEGSIPVLLAHPTSVAHGLNLQAGGNAVVWYSLTWNLEEFDQFNARVYRQGQTKPVTFHYIIASDTIDDNVLTALQAKDRTQKALMNALKEIRK